jgi:DNA-binding CsgD family transcriptional regulator
LGVKVFEMLENFLVQLAAASNIRQVVKVCSAKAFDLGATRCGYHLIPPFGNPVGENVRMFQKGYPPQWLARFEDARFRADDPITGWVMQHGRTSSWKMAIVGRKLTPGQQVFVAFANVHGLFDGISIPLFGPNGNDGYASVSLGDREISEADEALARLFTTVWQSGHRRIFRLVAHLREGPTLSSRESEILAWTAKSKSNADIAVILGVAPATVDTVVRRIFAKLGVHDRLAAVVCGLQNGLVKY